ncbi:helix-turn-helix domain-containing protein [Poriferisphaera sp. WC338]|uniref:helix-turn-helix domain-containing protein n=1 Tax=Poriferisphaera sp. WC338 TaxID=3425129 RepID=UPI003D81431B
MSATPTPNPLWHCPVHGQQTIPHGKRYYFDNRHRTPKHEVVIQISLRGSITFTHDHLQTIIPSNHLFMFVLGESTIYRKTHLAQAYENLWLNLSGAGILEHINLFRSRYNMMIDISSNNDLHDQMNHIRHLCGPTSPATATQISASIHHLIMSLFDFAEKQTTHQSPAQRAINMIISKPSYPWSIKQIADDVGCSREHFSRLFTETIGQPPAAYLNNIRITRAVQLLTETNLPIKHIAEQLGFPSPHTFARQIKSHTSLSPKHLRNKHQSS